MPRSTTRETVVWLSSSALVVVSTWKVLQWRARKRARRTVQQVKMKADGPMGPKVEDKAAAVSLSHDAPPYLFFKRSKIDYNDPVVRERILVTAMKRASKWMELSKDEAKPMVGQVGGMSTHKKPLLTLQPDYVLKPLITDHRGIREIAFYEALKTVSTKSKSADKTYHAFLTGRQPTSKSKSLQQPPQPFQSTTTRRRSLAGEYFDTFAMAFAILMQDPVVLESEAALHKAWRGIKRESEILAKLAKFTAPYYGVMGQNRVDQATLLGVTDDAHLLLQDLTINFKKPCVMDLKMGTQTYEPDATKEKRSREFGKYPQQSQFGFRIVGMRFYDPVHPDADEKGFRCFHKPYGRALTSMEDVKEAFRTYFTGGLVVAEEGEKMVKKELTNGKTAETETANGEGNSKTSTSNGTKPIPPQSQQQTQKSSIRVRSISSLLVHLRPLIRWFEENKALRLYASSLLIVYEGDLTADIDMSSIKMIDFGRVRREAGGDPGYMHGLNTMQSIFTDLLEQEKRIKKEHEEKRIQKEQAPSPAPSPAPTT